MYFVKNKFFQKQNLKEGKFSYFKEEKKNKKTKTIEKLKIKRCLRGVGEIEPDPLDDETRGKIIQQLKLSTRHFVCWSVLISLLSPEYLDRLSPQSNYYVQRRVYFFQKRKKEKRNKKRKYISKLTDLLLGNDFEIDRTPESERKNKTLQVESERSREVKLAWSGNFIRESLVFFFPILRKVRKKD